ncbi:HAD-IIA family hydrolase [Aliifodinibius sp. S!AR15-10]|uniref:HAD-IIA family hydrolase n=1 Tax=Aliifodinibius sp. S!AR15-10 TaxID=2950437 RepID=UPI002857269E|nr:HAD-IIA family hydrolase [Aliifodinibius sp. S!AR15-10]MDR8393912.1 HAD-IIA family hydrolase [Aliifodinibius sp. S!AR15-10]
MRHFNSIAKQYKAVFLDSYGVLKNHKGLIEGVEDTISFLRDEGILLRVLTNDASRSQAQQAEVFADLGLTNIKKEEIITSGMLARQFLENKITEGKIGYLGTENSAEYILQSGLQKIPARDINLDDADDITAFVFLDDEGFDWNFDINTTVNFLRRKNVPVIVANTDKYYPVSKNDVAVATGGIAELVQNMLEKEFIEFGKPDSQMFMHAYEHLLEEEPDIHRYEILMVGDTLHTDILGGNKFGLKTMLVFSGNTRKENAELQISATGIIPDYICGSIVE